MRQGYIVAENGTLQVLPLEDRLQKTESVGDDALAVEAIDQVLNRAYF